MSTIRLKNIKVYAFHGCLVEEEKIGSDYLVNLSVKANLEKAAVTDSLKDTVDYVHLQKIVKDEMAIRSKLIETVGYRILDRLKKESFELQHAKIEIKKINPPINGNVDYVSITVEE